jgi:hypothetical protein
MHEGVRPLEHERSRVPIMFDVEKAHERSIIIQAVQKGVESPRSEELVLRLLGSFPEETVLRQKIRGAIPANEFIGVIDPARENIGRVVRIANDDPLNVSVDGEKGDGVRSRVIDADQISRVINSSKRGAGRARHIELGERAIGKEKAMPRPERVREIPANHAVVIDPCSDGQIERLSRLDRAKGAIGLTQETKGDEVRLGHIADAVACFIDPSRNREDHVVTGIIERGYELNSTCSLSQRGEAGDQADEYCNGRTFYFHVGMVRNLGQTSQCQSHS